MRVDDKDNPLSGKECVSAVMEQVRAGKGLEPAKEKVDKKADRAEASTKRSGSKSRRRGSDASDGGGRKDRGK